MDGSIIDTAGVKYRFVQALMLLPNMLKLIYRLVGDFRVPLAEKAMLMATAAYIVMPMDFMPDFIPFMGQIDDLLLIALVFRRLVNAAGHELVMSYWDGDPEIMNTITWIIDWSEHILPAGIYDKIVRRASNKKYDVEYRVVD